MKTAVTVAILASTLSFVARAESLEEKKFWKTQRNYIDRELVITNKTCGTDLTFDWVDPPTLRAEVAKTKHSPMGVCLNILQTVSSICREGKDAARTVAAKITAVQCGFSKERNLDFRGGVVTYMGNNTQSNFTDWAKPWLMKRL